MDMAAGRWVYEFGDFRLDASRRLLSSVADGARVPITPKVFDTALYLVERAGELVPKSRLLAELWPSVVVEENSLTQVVSDLRRALGEARGENRYVVTVPRRGYQFVAEVARIARTPAAAVPESTLAVLPFEVFGQSAASEMVATGLADSILHALADVRGLRLVSHLSSFACRGQAGDARQVGRRLGASHLVEGSVQHAGSQLRITVQLVDATDGSDVWSLKFDRSATDLFALEDDVSTRVARAVRGSLVVPVPVPESPLVRQVVPTLAGGPGET